jgi:prevent-host-death family protein
MVEVTMREAQDRLGQLVAAARREPVAITQDGRPAVFLVSPGEVEELLESRRARSRTAAEFAAWSKRTAALATPAAAALTDEDVSRMVHESR